MAQLVKKKEQCSLEPVSVRPTINQKVCYLPKDVMDYLGIVSDSKVCFGQVEGVTTKENEFKSISLETLSTAIMLMEDDDIEVLIKE